MPESLEFMEGASLCPAPMPGFFAAPLAPLQEAAIFCPGASVGRSHVSGKSQLLTRLPLPSPGGARHPFHSDAKEGFLSGNVAK